MIKFEPIDKKSVKGPKPKPNTRPKGKDSDRKVRDMTASRGNYKTR